MQTGKFALLVAWILFAIASPLRAQHVIINEILYDTQGADDPTIMFTELYGDSGIDLNGYSLVGVCGHGGAEYLVVHLSGAIPDDGYFVVGGSGVSNVDLVMPHNWQNAGLGDDCDCIELRFQGEAVDKVRYGPCANPPGCEGEGGTNAPDYDPPSSGPTLSIGRIPDHQDTDDNAADWGISDMLTPGESNSIDTCIVHYYTISEVQEDNYDGTPVHAGEFVHIIGIATIDNYILNPTILSFFIQDENAGVNIFGSYGIIEVTAGDCVIVEGWVAHYNGLTEIVTSGSGTCIWDLEVVYHVDVPEPLVVTCGAFDSLAESYEGMLVKIECVTIVNGEWPPEGENANLIICDQTGCCAMRIDKDTDIDGQPQPEEPFDVVAIANQYDPNSPYHEGYQILPRAYNDFTDCLGTDGWAAEIPASFKLLGCFPNPFNTTTRIAFTVERPTDVSVHIYDPLGRKVMSASIPAPSPGEYSYIWNGRNSTGQILSTGLYFV